MQQEFEKRVQEKLEELNLVPSPPVWQKVEERIREKRRRRRALIWLPLLGLLLAGGGIAIWMIDGDKEPVARVEPSLPETSKPVNSNTNSTTQFQQQRNNQIDKGGEEEINLFTEEKVIELSDSDAAQVNSVTPASTDRKENETPTRKAQKENTSQVITESTVRKSITAGEKRNEFGSAKASHPETGSERAAEGSILGKDTSGANTGKRVDLLLPAIVPPVFDTVHARDVVMAPFARYEQNLVCTSPGIPIEINAGRKWKIGISAAAGFSGQTEGLKLREEKSARITSASAPGVPSAAAPPASLAANNYKPSSPKNHWEFSVGISARKPLSNKLYLQTGLQYDYLSNTIEVGGRSMPTATFGAGMGTTFSPNRNSGRVNQYTNRYHFVSLPLALQYQPVVKTPLLLHAGLSLRRLIATDALVYDERSLVYVADKDAFRSNQFFSQFGLSYRLPMGGFQLEGGPQISLALSPLQKEGSRQHLFSMGLGVRLYKKN